MINFAYGNALLTSRVDYKDSQDIQDTPQGSLASIMILPDKSTPFVSTRLHLLQAFTIDYLLHLSFLSEKNLT